MKIRGLLVLALAVSASLAVAVSASGRSGQAVEPIPEFTAEQLTAYTGANFPSWNGNIHNQRYSTLNQINARNVRNLKIVWHKRLFVPGQKLKAGQFGVMAAQSPVVYGG